MFKNLEVANVSEVQCLASVYDSDTVIETETIVMFDFYLQGGSWKGIQSRKTKEH